MCSICQLLKWDFITTLTILSIIIFWNSSVRLSCPSLIFYNKSKCYCTQVESSLSVEAAEPVNGFVPETRLCVVLLPFFFSLSESYFLSPCDIIDCESKVNQAVPLCVSRLCGRPALLQRKLLMWGFIYLTDLLPEGVDYGGSCQGSAETSVLQCSVPHYCCLMRRTEGLEHFPSGPAVHDNLSSYLHQTVVNLTNSFCGCLHTAQQLSIWVTSLVMSCLKATKLPLQLACFYLLFLRERNVKCIYYL